MLSQSSAVPLSHQVHLTSPSERFEIDIFTHASPQRCDVENFIKQGFIKAYKAKISVTMPYLLAIKHGEFKAALGIRGGEQPLFLEQYLDKPIEMVDALQDKGSARSQIAEIGHLYSNTRRFTLQLFLVTAVALYCRDYRFMVFSGTQHVLQLLSQIGLNLQIIAKADPARLVESTDEWGSYYDTMPHVAVLDLFEVMRFIQGHESYLRLFQQLESRIAEVTLSLQGEQL